LQKEYAKINPNAQLFFYFLYIDKADFKLRKTQSTQPLNMIAIGLSREKVFKVYGTARIADVPVLRGRHGGGISQQRKTLINHWMLQKTVELAIRELKRWSHM
jgi:hypothetical protein